MKKILSLALLSAMLVVMLLSLASCSAYGGIEKNFTDAGWKVIDTNDEDGKNTLSFVANLGKDEDGKVSATTHIIKKKIGVYAVIMEFNADADAKKALEQYMTRDDIKNYMELSEEAKLINANCVLIPVCISLTAKADAKEMIELFNK